MVVHNRRWLILLLMAMVPLHVDRLQPFLGLQGAVGFNFWRACDEETVVQLVSALYFVQFRSGGGKRWPDVARAVAPLHVDRFQPFLGLHGAVGFNLWRA